MQRCIGAETCRLFSTVLAMAFKSGRICTAFNKKVLKLPFYSNKIKKSTI